MQRTEFKRSPLTDTTLAGLERAFTTESRSTLSQRQMASRHSPIRAKISTLMALCRYAPGLGAFTRTQ